MKTLTSIYRNARCRGSRSCDEAGFSLIELTIVIVIIPMVIGAITLVFITGLKATDSHDPESTAARLADSHDTQITASYFVRDVESAQDVTTQTAGPPLCGTGSQLLGLEWTHDENEAAPVIVKVSYVITTTSPYTLVREYCQGSNPASASTVSHNLFQGPQFTGLEPLATPNVAPPVIGSACVGTASTANTCASSGGVNAAWVQVNCIGPLATGCGSSGAPVSVEPSPPNPGIKTVQLTVHEALSGYSYTLTGTPREEPLVTGGPICNAASNPPCLPHPPLLLLGSGTSVIGCVGSNGAVTVNGLAAVDSSSNGSVNMQNSTLTATGLYTTDTTNTNGAYTGRNPSPPLQSGAPVPDPYETALPYDGDAQGAQKAEPLTAPAPTAPNPNGTTYNPGYYPTGLRISGNGTFTFASGVYVFNGGLSVTGGANISSGPGGVLFYIQNGGISLTGSGTVNLTALPSSSGFDDVVIWDSELDSAPAVALGGNGSVVSITGVVYAPTATVSTGGNGAISISNLVSNKLACNGNGTSTIGAARGGNNADVVTTPSAQTIAVNNAVTDSALVTGNPNGPAPTGTINFYSCSPSVLAANSATTCTSAYGTQIPGTVPNPNPATLVANSTSSSAASSPSIMPNTTGTWCFAGYYSGDLVYPAANDTSFDECFSVTSSGSAPSGVSIASTPNPKDGKPDSGDKISFTYSTTMSAASIKSGWNGTSVAVTAAFSHCAGNSAPDCLTITGVNLGSVNLGGQYVSTGNHSYTASATMVMTTNGSGQSVVTITLTSSPSSNVNTNVNSFAMVWTPSSLATDTSNNACSTATVTEASAAENF